MKVPERRKAVIIGKHGETKLELELKTKTRINISEDIEISGEPIEIMEVESVITAIGRGFSPKDAMKLLDENNIFYVINIPKRGFERIRARLIGTNGKARRKIERTTKTSLAIYGKTVCIIGTTDNVKLAKIAIEKIITGAPHKNVYKTIRKIKK